jgi:FdhD protein
MVGIPIIAAVGAPSSLAVDLADEHSISLIGFLKEDRFNIYCGAQRIDLEKLPNGK